MGFFTRKSCLWALTLLIPMMAKAESSRDYAIKLCREALKAEGKNGVGVASTPLVPNGPFPVWRCLGGNGKSIDVELTKLTAKAADTLEGIKRNVAADVCARQVAPAAYVQKPSNRVKRCVDNERGGHYSVDTDKTVPGFGPAQTVGVQVFDENGQLLRDENGNDVASSSEETPAGAPVAATAVAGATQPSCVGEACPGARPAAARREGSADPEFVHSQDPGAPENLEAP